MAHSIQIRHYQQRDHDAVRKICELTAWPEYQVDPKRLECVCLMFNDYYTIYEPEHIFVAVDVHNQPIGYIICKTQPELYQQVMKTVFYPKIATLAPEECAFLTTFLDILASVQAIHPVHFHIDIHPDYHRRGIGVQLLDALKIHLRTAGFDQFMLYAYSTTAPSYQFYRNYGFTPVTSYCGDGEVLNYNFEK